MWSQEFNVAFLNFRYIKLSVCINFEWSSGEIWTVRLLFIGRNIEVKCTFCVRDELSPNIYLNCINMSTSHKQKCTCKHKAVCQSITPISTTANYALNAIRGKLNDRNHFEAQHRAVTNAQLNWKMPISIFQKGKAPMRWKTTEANARFELNLPTLLIESLT